MPEGMPEDGEAPQGGDGMRGDRSGPGGTEQSSSDQVIRVHVDGHIIDFESDPYIKNDSTLVGVRSILEALGAEVSWDGDSQTVTILKDDTEIILTVSSDTAYVDGAAQTLSAAPEMSGNSVMIPVRFISEQLGMTVSWEESTRLITITSK